MRLGLVSLVVLCALASLSTAARAKDVVRIGGTGMGLRAMERLGEQLSGSGADVAVRMLPSLGSSGGINALLRSAIEIALTARPITPAEQDKGLAQAACMTTALVFATPKAASPGMDDAITSAQLPALYADPRPLWPDLTPMKIILRSPAGSEVPYLIGKIPAMAAAFDLAYKRAGMPIGMTDQQNINLATQIQGSLAITTLLQIRAENIALRPLRFDGVDPAAVVPGDSRYALPLQMCLLVMEKPAGGVAKFVAHMKTPKGMALLRSFGAALNK